MAPPKITKQAGEIPLKLTATRTFAPVALTPLHQQVQDRYETGTSSAAWNPRSRGQMARPATPAWRETASEMERYVRSGESAQDIVDFGLGELEGGRDTLQATLQGAAQIVSHPIDSARQVNQAVWASGPALSEFSKHSDRILLEAADRTCRQFVQADNRQRGRMLGGGLTEAALAVAPFPKLTSVVKGASGLVARTLPKAALAERIQGLPLLVKLRRPLGRVAPEAQLRPRLEPPREATGFLGKKGWEMKNLHGPHPAQNAPTEIHGLHYSGHSLDQMRNRGFTPSVIENAIIHGQASAGRKGRRIFTDFDNRLRVILDPTLSSVVTTMRGIR